MTEAIKEVALEVARRDATGLAGVRRVRVCLTPAFRLPSGEDRRRLILVTDKSECRALVEPGVSWDAVLAQVEMLLALEDESRREAAS
ncbi:MAG: hypothetical protein OXJ37_10950 [Bryobacterales bacterium]|nr:hypothetical protein [Bryobacterales bacterium]